MTPKIVQLKNIRKIFLRQKHIVWGEWLEVRVLQSINLSLSLSLSLSLFLSLDSATPPREDYVHVDFALQSRYKV